MRRHNHLTDDVFKNSKYIATINRTTDFKDIRKETRKEKSEYFGQYDLILDIFQTFILVFNCFFSDSNKNKVEKADEARTIIEKLIYKDYENSQTHKYTVRDIKEIVDKRARRLYKYMEQWQKELKKITPKNANDSIFLNEMIATLEKEMNDLEYVEFDSIVNENITYQKNSVKNYKDYKKYICKFDYIYNKRDEFINEFKEKYYKRTRISLTDDDIDMFRKVFTTITYGNNGLINTINNADIETKNINEKSSDKYIYKAYLKLNGIDYNSDNFKLNVMAFSLMLQSIYNKAMFCGLNKYDVLRNFDVLVFIITCEELIITDEVKFGFVDNDINGIILDLKDVYKTIRSSQMTYEEIGTDTKRYNEETLIPAYQIIRNIIERNKDILMEIS